MKRTINGTEYEIGPTSYLSGANLRNADLRDAYLRDANLRDAYLRGARYSIPQILLAQWGTVSDDLCRQLMRLDAEALPSGSRLMTAWANGGACPLSSGRYERAALFHERKECWKPGRPWSLWRIWRTLAAEKGVKIDGVNS